VHCPHQPWRKVPQEPFHPQVLEQHPDMLKAAGPGRWIVMLSALGHQMFGSSRRHPRPHAERRPEASPVSGCGSASRNLRSAANRHRDCCWPVPLGCGRTTGPNRIQESSIPVPASLRVPALYCSNTSSDGSIRRGVRASGTALSPWGNLRPDFLPGVVEDYTTDLPPASAWILV